MYKHNCKVTNRKELVSIAQATLDYIDALPGDMVVALDEMAGFDRDGTTNVNADTVDETYETHALAKQQLSVTQLPVIYFFYSQGNISEAYFLADSVRELLRTTGIQLSE